MTEIEKKRKFHDMWAFVLYLVFTTVTFVFMIKEMKEMPKNIGEIVLPALFSNVGILFGFMLLVFLALRFMAKTFIFFVNVIVPVIAFVALLFTFNPAAIIFGAISLAISLWFYFAYINPVLPLIAAAVKTTSKILASNFLGCLGVLIFSVSIQVVQAYLLLRILGQDKGDQSALFVLFIFNNYWTVFNVVYFTQVLVSSIVIGHVMDEGATFNQALYNSVAALGSVSFASLIMALITTARVLVEREAERDSERRDRSLLKTILLCLSACILAILGDLVNTMNELAFPYLALYGTGYTESIRESYNLISEKRGLTLLNNVAIGKVIFFCLILFIEILVAGDVVLLYMNPSIQKNESIFVSLAIIGIPSVLFAYEFLSMFSSGSLALIYAYIESPSSVEKIDSELVEKMKAFN